MGQLTFGERQNLALSTNTQDRARRLATLWTFKEGYTKAIGLGIGFGLERIELQLGQDGEVDGVYVDGTEVGDSGWAYTHGRFDDGYAWMAMWRGSKAGVTAPEICHVSWSDFLSAFT